MVHGITLSRKSLTLLIAISVLVPVGCGLGLAFLTRKIPEPPLDAQVRIDHQWIEPKSVKEAQRLVPAIAVRNPTAEPWKNLSIGLNAQFYAQEPKGIPPGETVSIPLEAFVARNGSVRFPTDHREVRRVTVFAQIGTGARAVSEFEIPASTLEVVTAPRNDAQSGWIEPTSRKPSPR